MITKLKENEIFVFGSNQSGYHGAGAAKQALQWGAKYGIGSGFCGKTYAIPTKDWRIHTLSLTKIEPYVKHFMLETIRHPEYTFLVTEIGCGLAGYKPIDIAPMFSKVFFKENVVLPNSFKKILSNYRSQMFC